MKTQLTQVVQSKHKTKKDLAYLKNKYIAIIYGGLSKQESVKKIHKKLYDETINQKKAGKDTSAEMLNLAFKSVSVLKKQTNNLALVKSHVKTKYGVVDEPIASMLGLFLVDKIKNKNIEKTLSSVIRKEANKKEGESKEKIIDDILSHNLEESRSKGLENENKPIDTSKIKIFYLASWHKDSASDHKDYQGKIYVDENWTSLEMPYDLHTAIEYYIRSHNVKTLQWVVGSPVWFITRPNCRHYFKELSVKEVLKFRTKKLLKKYNMKTAIGDREYLQTIKHSTSKKWYDEVRNAELLLESYKERLSMHEMMYKENPCAILKNAIEKDKFLIQKWEKYIASKK